VYTLKGENGTILEKFARLLELGLLLLEFGLSLYLSKTLGFYSNMLIFDSNLYDCWTDFFWMEKWDLEVDLRSLSMFS